MNEVVGAGVAFILFILITVTVLSFQTGMWFDQTTVLLKATERHTERLDTSIDVIDQNCGASVDLELENTGSTLIADFSEMDVFVDYVTVADVNRSARLIYDTDWTISGIAPDTNDPNVWNPQEVATFDITLSPAMKDGTTGYVSILTPNSAASGFYVSQSAVIICLLYLHNNPTPPVADTNAQAVLPMDTSPPSATILYNYGQDRDTDSGLTIQRGGTGPGESDSLKHQVWRSGALSGRMRLAGEVAIDFWSALKDYKAVNLTTYYLHNNPTPPVADTDAQAVLPVDKSSPSATTLYNYDQDRDSDAGLLLKKDGVGPGESDSTKHQVWRSGTLASPLAMSGIITIDFWSGLKGFLFGTIGDVTWYLRDYDGNSHTEIGNATVIEADWQGGVNDFVLKTATFADLSYTIPAGNELEVEVVVGNASGDDFWFAYDTTSHTTVINLPVTTGTVGFFLRDYNGSSHVEIGNGTVTDSDWQGGTSDFVLKTITIPDVNYTVPKGNELEFEVVVGSGSGNDLWFAYDTVTRTSGINPPK